VLFFLAEPLPDGGIPRAAAQIEGVKVPAQNGVWGAAVELSNDMRKTIPISVQVTNGVGLTTTRTLFIHVVDGKNTSFIPPAGSEGSKHIPLEIGPP
jgi:hypothetical protein